MDVDRLQLVGEPQTVVDSVAVRINRGVFSASQGALLYRTAISEGRRFLWFGRDGAVQGTAASTPGSVPRLSPDGRQIALNRIDDRTGAGDIWLEDLSRKVSTRLTSHPAYDWTPVWSPDGRSIAFASNRDAIMHLYVKAVDGSEPERLVWKSEQRKVPTDPWP
jgi:Tol biopolymer transport system component